MSIGFDKAEADGFTVSLNVWVKSHGHYDGKLLLDRKLIDHLKSLIPNT